MGEYISTAAPVGSAALVRKYRLPQSPATIRNEMAYLEQEGYIIRPHTSAGSIPSDKGYRCYVQSLENIKLPPAEQRLISHLFHQVEMELEEWLSLAATLIAQLVQNVAMVTLPKSVGCQFRHVELVALQDSLVLVVLVLCGARVKQQLITFNQVIAQPQLVTTANKLNDVYFDLTVSQILAKDKGLSLTERAVTDCLIRMMQAENEHEYEEPYINGLHFMLNQPEFVRTNRILALMELAEHRNLLKTITPHGPPSHGVQVVIGKENEAVVIHDYSVVISRYGLSEEAVGTISVVGPTRMPYAHTISTVDYLATVLNELMAELYGKQAPKKGNTSDAN